MIFFGDFGQKTRTAGLIMLKLSTKVNQVFWGKNLENENFMAAAIHCKNWYFKKTNIFHYFPSKNLKYSQIFLSETIHAQENGSRGPHFAKSLNSNFLKGLTYSAMSFNVSDGGSRAILILTFFRNHYFACSQVLPLASRFSKLFLFLLYDLSFPCRYFFSASMGISMGKWPK